MSAKIRASRAAAVAVSAILLVSGCSSSSEGTATAPATTASSAASDTPEPSTVPSPTAQTPEETGAETDEPADETADTEEVTEEATVDEPADETFPEQTVDTESPDALALLAEIDAALLTADDLGNGFVQGTYTAPDPADTSSTLPCGQVNTAVAFPNALRTGTTLTLDESAQFQQGVSYFLDAATASDAFAYAVEGISCTDAELGGTAATVSEPQDVTADVGGDAAVAWEVTIGEDSAVLIAVLSGSMSVGYTFAIAGGSDSSTLPNPVEVAAFATEKLLAAGL